MLWKKDHKHPLCCLANALIALLLLAATLTAGMGVYQAHVLSSGVVFGTTSGSLSLLSFVVSLGFFAKHMCTCCEKYCTGK